MFDRIRKIINCIRDTEHTFDWQVEGNFRELYENVSIGFAVNDISTGRFIRVNPAFCDIVGYTADELCKMTYWDLTPAEYTTNEHQQLQDMKHGHAYGPYEKEYIHKDGHLVPVLLSGVALKNISGPEIVWSVVQDISQRREAENAVYHLAYYDSLTGLPNRAHFVEKSKVILQYAKMTESHAGFFLIDVDNFKRINDSLGHAFGDKVLQHIGDQLTECIKHTCEDTPADCGRSFCARLGGDEFVLIIERIMNQFEAETLAQKILEHFSEPVVIDGRSVTVSIGIGISIYPNDGEGVSHLLKAADLALYAAKEQGKNQYHFHTESITTRFDEFYRYEHIIEYFIETEDFELHFQPIYDIKLGRPIGTEALFRANEKKFGKLDLGFLIEVAEETGLIVNLGAAIFKVACEKCATCTLMGDDRIVSINVSVRQLEDPNFIEMCCTTMRKAGVQPSNIALEVTESLMMKEGHVAVQKLTTLQDMGVQIFIDDFGKGYSSMTYLRHLPSDKLKIDMDFIRDIEDDPTAVEIIRGINLLAHSLDMITCAEGVETKEQLQILTKLGVDQVQGYYIGRPMDFDTLKHWVKTNYGDCCE
jgi:diguanylate cyclase (GGDEF)-like protein/PAS domain S-box-containing protein